MRCMAGRGGLTARQYLCNQKVFVITDGKRNDIGSTMEAYAAAHLSVTRVRV